MATQNELLAPMDGLLMPLREVPDEVFATGMLGDGFAIAPREDMASVTVCAPADGQIETVADAGHAYTLHTDDGLELLVHIGIDTVTLKGTPFRSLVSAGDRVKAGDALVRADLAAIRAADLPTVTPVLITNPEILSDLSLALGEAEGGVTAAARYRTANREKKGRF